MGRHRAGQVGGQAGSADEDGEALLAGGPGERRHLVGRAMGRQDVLVGLDAQPTQHLGDGGHLVPVARRAHEHGHSHRTAASGTAPAVGVGAAGAAGAASRAMSRRQWAPAQAIRSTPA